MLEYDGTLLLIIFMFFHLFSFWPLDVGAGCAHVILGALCQTEPKACSPTWVPSQDPKCWWNHFMAGRAWPAIHGHLHRMVLPCCIQSMVDRFQGLYRNEPLRSKSFPRICQPCLVLYIDFEYVRGRFAVQWVIPMSRPIAGIILFRNWRYLLIYRVLPDKDLQYGFDAMLRYCWRRKRNKANHHQRSISSHQQMLDFLGK